MTSCREDTYNICSITLNGKDDDCAGKGADDGANSPKQGLAVQHLAEGFAGLVAQVEPLAELGASGTVDGAHVLDEGVDAGAERCAHGQGRDSARSWLLHITEDIDEDQLNANGEEHSRCGHGEHTDGRVVGTCATSQD